jgi:hypothetical protein
VEWVKSLDQLKNSIPPLGCVTIISRDQQSGFLRCGVHFSTVKAEAQKKLLEVVSKAKVCLPDPTVKKGQRLFRSDKLVA